MNSLVRQSFRIILGRASVSTLSLLFTIYFAYELPKNLFAIIALYSTAASFTQVMIDLGLSIRMIREAPALLKEPSTRDKGIQNVVMPSTVLRFIAAGATALIMMGSLQLIKSPLMHEFPNLNITYIILLAPIAMMFENGNSTLASIFQVERRFGTDSMLTSGATFLESILTVIMYILFGMNQYFLGVILAQSFIFFLRLFLIRKIIFQFRWNELSWKASKPVLKLYLPFYIRRFFRFGLLQGEQLLIALLLPLNQLANFNLAKKLSKYLKFYTEAFENPLSIKLARSQDIALRNRYRKTFLLFTIPLPIIMALISPWLMRYAGGEKYADNWPILAILCLSYIFYALASLQFSIISIFGKHTDSLYRDIIGSLTGFFSTLILILIFAEYGLAWGQLIAYATLYMAGYQISKKYMNAPLPFIAPAESAKPETQLSTKPVT